MTVVLSLHPKINCMTIPPMVPVKNLGLFPSVVISAIIFPGCKSSDIFIVRPKLTRRQVTSKQ